MSDALVARVRSALRRPTREDEGYLALLTRRLAGLARLAQGEASGTLDETARERALARRFVRAREASWHDGDENLLREWLDTPAAGSARDEARRLLRTASHLAAIEARPETLWCFLWELEARWPAVRGGC